MVTPIISSPVISSLRNTAESIVTHTKLSDMNGYNTENSPYLNDSVMSMNPMK